MTRRQDELVRPRKMKVTALVGLIIIAASAVPYCSVGYAQERVEKAFTIGGNVLASAAAAERPLVEPQVVAHPKDPRHLVAVAIVSSEPPHQPQADCAAFTSFDGGQTWTQHNFGISNCGDPWVALRDDGEALFAGLVTRGEIRLLRSTDGARSWLPLAVDLGRGHDHQMVIVDASAGPRAGSFYVVSGRMQRNKAGRGISSVFVTRSADGGRTFRPPADFVANNLNSNALTPGLLSDGTLVLPYFDFQSNADDFKGTGFLERKRLWVVASSDGGQTFSHAMFVSEACGSGGGFASLAVDA